MSTTNRPRFPEVWDSTLRGSFVACPQAFKNAHVELLAPHELSIHLIAGGAVAAGLERARREWCGGTLAETAVAHGLYDLIKAYGNPNVPERNKNKDFHHTVLAYCLYFQAHPLDSGPFSIAVINGKPAIEFTFCFELPITHPETGMPVQYAGRCDWATEYQGMIGNADEKTCTAVGAKWAQQWRLRAQFEGYAYAYRLHGINTKFTLVRGIQMLTADIHFHEAIVYHEDWKLDRWYKQVVRDITRAKQCFIDNEWDYDFGSSCTSYSGCQFADLCLTNQPENWLHLYKKLDKPWSPLGEFKEEGKSG